MQDIAKALKQYLEQIPPNYRDAESVLDILYWHYTEHGSPDGEKLCNLFAELRKLVNLPSTEYDSVFCVVSDLCMEHGRLAFSEGLYMGMELMLELNRSKGGGRSMKIKLTLSNCIAR